MQNNILNDGIGSVQLIQYTGNDLQIVNSARVSFGKKVLKFGDNDRNLIRFLLKNEHGTPLEHNSLTFLVKCPIFVARQWHRHRIGISINEISARYVEVQEEFYIPQKNSKIFEESTTMSFNKYKELLSSGVPREQARVVLPLSMYTEYYWTCNLRSFLLFIKLRNTKHAQFEIRQYAKAMLNLVKEIFPETIAIWEELNS